MTSVGPAAAFELSAFLREERERAEAALARAVAAWEERLPLPVTEALRHGVTSGGKRVRPVLCVAAYRAAGGDASDEAVHDLGASIELVHAYSLMHDDLPCMDDAELRRGRSTTWRVHGVEGATVAGAALIPMAVAEAWRAARRLGCDERTAGEVARSLTEAAGAGGMVGGQVLDLEAEGRRLDGDALDLLHRLKTGALLTAALRMGGLAAGAAPATVGALEAYGRAIGLAFQIVDDVLDATASAGELGKNPSDRERDKSTYVSLHGLDEARRRGEAEVERALAALDGAGIEARPLRALARYIVERRR